MVRWIALGLALMAIAVGIWQLERARSGLVITHDTAGTIPLTVYRRPDATDAPAVIIAHGFAGSRKLMEAYALTLARAGYVAVSFDFAGHGTNPRPMSGDITRIEGTTRQLMAEIRRVTDYALALPQTGTRAALLGHSMAADIIVRQAIVDDRIRAVVAISMFSEAVTATEPENLLVITGEWEGFLREQALKTIRIGHPGANAGDTVGEFARGTARRAIVAPAVEHVAVLYSSTAMRAARRWLDEVFDRQSTGPVAATGGWIVLLLAGIVLAAWPLSRALPPASPAPAHIPLRAYLIAALAPAVLVPALIAPLDVRFLPVLVADYLALHLLAYGVLTLAILWRFGLRLGRLAWISGLALAAYGIFVFGGALDRYVANFMPNAGRLPIIAAIAIGAVAYMTADSRLAAAGRAPFWRVLVQRTAFLASLGLAVAIAPERLFFLLIILPVIIVFYAIFGVMGGWVGRRTASPLAAGLGMGLTLAWATGVTFPLFSPQ
jgi:hypothetical protein